MNEPKCRFRVFVSQVIVDPSDQPYYYEGSLNEHTEPNMVTLYFNSQEEATDAVAEHGGHAAEVNAQWLVLVYIG